VSPATPAYSRDSPRVLELGEDTAGMHSPMSVPSFSAAMRLLLHFEGRGHGKSVCKDRNVEQM